MIRKNQIWIKAGLNCRNVWCGAKIRDFPSWMLMFSGLSLFDLKKRHFTIDVRIVVFFERITNHENNLLIELRMNWLQFDVSFEEHSHIESKLEDLSILKIHQTMKDNAEFPSNMDIRNCGLHWMSKYTKNKVVISATILMRYLLSID